ncbi:hypothetical protein BO71DRAFT_60851 [Aspergillus ellipticus CBS 707.79]|uniref:Uncharacterized protein n=1 Tax=Aspergillus ellipticus CBS 707.79 TaxID=1448320 RepID=A0A319D0C9_9EURO|nr:hypothetical protein BO71DRAFT_60851 [Aspergillus ellipticus CBS 707.79]
MEWIDIHHSDHCVQVQRSLQMIRSVWEYFPVIGRQPVPGHQWQLVEGEITPGRHLPGAFCIPRQHNWHTYKQPQPLAVNNITSLSLLSTRPRATNSQHSSRTRDGSVLGCQSETPPTAPKCPPGQSTGPAWRDATRPSASCWTVSGLDPSQPQPKVYIQSPYWVQYLLRKVKKKKKVACRRSETLWRTVLEGTPYRGVTILAANVSGGGERPERA